MRPPFLFAALSLVLLSSCYSPGDGLAPPLNEVYFPTGVALDVIPSTDPTVQPAKPQHLFVASSDFDLQYRASSLISYNLDTLSAILPQLCNTDADCTPDDTCDNVENMLPEDPDPEFVPGATYFCVKRLVAPQTFIDPCPLPLALQRSGYQILYPGHCTSIDPPSLDAVAQAQNKPLLIADAVQIGAFATDVVFRVPGLDDLGMPIDPTEQPIGRLFLPVRGDATLHWVDVNDTDPAHMGQVNYSSRLLDCGEANTPDNSCDGAHRIGDDNDVESPDGLRQEPEPFAIALDDAGQNVAITNQTTGSISLYVNHWTPKNAELSAPPELVYLLGGLPTAPVGLVALPTPKLLDQSDYEPGFLAVYEDAPQVDLLRVHVDASSDPYTVRTLTRAASTPINANSVGSDSRGIVIDDSQRQVDYAACLTPACASNSVTDRGTCQCGTSATCKQDLQNCLQAVHQPNVFVSNRAPASLLVGAFAPNVAYAAGTSELPAFTDSIPLNVGPSRVVLGKVKVVGKTYQDASGTGTYDLEQRVFVVCFDSRRIYIYDPARHVIDSIVTTGRGPFALAIDDQRGLGYVAHFTDSYLGVISLDQRFPQNYAAIIASVGVPTAPRASK